MYTLQYQLTDEDYIQYNITHQFSTPMLRRRVQTYRFIFGALYAVLALIWFLLLRRSVFSVIFGILLTGAACYYLFGMTWRIKRSIRRSIDKMKNMGKLPYDVNNTVTFTEDGIHSVSDDKEETVKYSAVERILLGDDAFYIYQAAISAIIVPYRAFETEQARQEFLTFLEAKTQITAEKGRTQ